MRTLYRDISSDELKKAADMKKAFEKLPDSDEDATAVLQSLPRELRAKLMRTLRQLED